MIYLMKASNWMKEFFSKMGKRQEKGQTLIEYALIIGLIVLVVVVAMNALGPQIATTYNKITTNLAAIK
jgi:pilus assembly protein Flp/PilA